MEKETTAIIISLIAVFVSLISAIIAIIALGWNIYRDLLKPKLKVYLGVYMTVTPEFADPIPKLSINATNFGPGKIQINGVLLKTVSFLNKTKYAFLIQNYRDALTTTLPCDLEFGEPANIFLKFSENCFLKDQYTHIGVRDTFGRIHWTSRKNYKKAKISYEKWFVNTQKK